MSLLLSLLLLAAPGPAATAPPSSELADAEARAMLHVRQSFERVGRSSPVSDPALSQAARTLAREALLATAEAASGTRIGLAVSEAGGWDPNPRLVLIRSWPTQTTLQAFLQRKDFTSEAATHAGLAVVGDDDHTVLALLLADRKAVVQPFPRKVEKAPSRQRLCFELRAPITRPSVYVTRPSGAVDRLSDISGRGPSYCALVVFPTSGRHALEVLGDGAEGPEVAAMFSVDVGPVAPVAGAGGLGGPEPASPAEARTRLLQRVNTLRAAAGVPAVQPDLKLEAVAQTYADRMATQRFFAHVSPDGDSLPDRLEQAGYAYQASGENLGMASGPLAAHAAIEESPGHRKNLLDPAFERVGFGLARQGRDGGTGSDVILVELLATPARSGVDPVASAYARLTAERAALKLPALQRSAALEDIAVRQARAALARDDPRAPDIDSQVFGALSEARAASADLYVARDLAALPPSRGLKEARYSLVGIGAVRGDSPTYGKGRYWVVVIYAGM
ncbi:MAG TPA: CAP domain-containing protein [Myxococcaceae bacterium]|nr:CAP domain-containing protein [Myxococcaceae bacterium]